ncbi:anti-phage dCTP deaminase [Niveispirillum sp. SYP-B3756]|uniref:anti-phage dCTP deaminase n=1 Tax=Niveispirillum sp. SYP-B3756 TaxID=2662178 RepID=UPI0015663A3E|nr:anti-phage dCTP deaminase [Niveispirillum sp. SYP-B3756]
MLKSAPLFTEKETPETNHLANNLSDRMSQEIIFVLVGPVGSGVSTTAEKIRSILQSQFKYTVPEIIRMSEFIANDANKVSITVAERDKLDRYITTMQDAGNKLREKFGANYLAARAVEKIVNIREKNSGYSESAGERIIQPKRIAYIIDSIKNIEEYKLLKQVYGDILVLFGVFAPDQLREKRLSSNGAASSETKNIIDRDQADIPTFGQMTRKTFIESDFYICNDQKLEELDRKVRRLLDIIFDVNIHTPTRAESAMYEAEAAAMNSACMSRQVGASIVSDSGELIAIGWNDVPKFGGGLYNEGDQMTMKEGKIIDSDNRCFKYKGNICHNEIKRRGIIEKVVEKMISGKLFKKEIGKSDVIRILSGTEIDSIIEYSRSIHAEMEAILSVAREGKNSLLKSTMYTTTYPCHNCARHIVAAGIKEVVYIQPYQKSLAIELHGDAISELQDDTGRVIFRQYDGVAPRNFIRAFKSVRDRKSNGRLARPNSETAYPIFRTQLDSFSKYEDKVVADLLAKVV